MLVTFNEVLVLCRKAFEGLGMSPGELEDAAQMVAWAQLHGLKGIDTLTKGLGFMEVDATRSPRICYEDASTLVMTCGGQSVLRSAVVAMEMAAAKATTSGLATLRIVNCHNRSLVLAYLGKISARGLNISVRWSDRQQEALAAFRAGSSCPHLWVFKRDEGRGNDEQSVNVTFSQHITALASAAASDVVLELNESDLLEQARAQYLSGISVEPEAWAALKLLGERVLVESTEESRQRGAGESSQSIARQQ